MRVAQIIRSVDHLAGTERFVLETTREMAGRGIETRIYTCSADSRILSNLQEVQIVSGVPASAMPFEVYSSLLVSRHLIDVASSWADVIILHSGAGVAEYGWRKHRLPCIPFFHVDDKYESTLFGYYRVIASLYTYPVKLQESRCVRRAPLVFANSRSLRSGVQLHIQGDRMTVIPLGVNIHRFRPTWNDDEYILMVGRINPTNNFELGLRAAANTSCKIVVAGIHEQKFAWYFRYLRKLVDESNHLRNRVEFLAPSDDELIRLLQNCSLFLSPRIYDYLGLAALEAMACGKPVIAYNADEDSHHPPVMKCGKTDSMWQETLKSLMGDRYLREKIGRESRQFIEEHHTWKNTVDSMLEGIRTGL